MLRRVWARRRMLPDRDSNAADNRPAQPGLDHRPIYRRKLRRRLGNQLPKRLARFGTLRKHSGYTAKRTRQIAANLGQICLQWHAGSY